jgi:hypothetical protein
MTFEAFLDKIYNKLAKKYWLTPKFLDPKSHLGEPKPVRYDTGFTFCVTWSKGGTYGDYEGNITPAFVQDEEELTAFDDILGIFCPNITFLQYKKIASEVIIKMDIEHSDYYGGSTVEGHKGFMIRTLYDTLSSYELL